MSTHAISGRGPADFLQMMFARRGFAGGHDQDEGDQPRGRRGGGSRFGPFGRFPFGGPGWPFGGGWERHGGPRARRGDVRAAALALLAEQPMNGYQIIQEIKQRSDGLWKPSSGSVYPALQQLEDEGLVQAGEHEGRRAFSLTAAGRAYVEEHADELKAPWAAMTENVADTTIQLQESFGQLAWAFAQVTRAGTPEQVEQAKRIIDEARRALYRTLADDNPEDTPGDAHSADRGTQ